MARRPPLDEDQALDLLDRRVNPRGYQPERMAFEELMLRSVLYTTGKQHFHQNGASVWEFVPETEHEVIYRANIILPAIERAIAKVMSASGDFQVAPQDGSPEARRKAKLSQRLLEHLWHDADYSDEKLEALRWAAICGTGYLQVTWDPNRGERQRFYENDRGAPILPANQEQAIALEEAGRYTDLAMGDVAFQSLSPFTVHWDWDARKGVQEAFWMATNQLLSIPRVAEHFGVDEKSLPEVGDTPGSSVFDEAIAFITSGLGRNEVGFGYKPRSQDSVGRTLLTIFYHRPTQRYPRGIYVVRAGNQILMVRDNPYRDSADGLPFVKHDWIKIPGRFLGIGLTEQALSSQFQYNAARAKMTEFQNVWGMPPVLLPEGMDTDTWILKPGMVYSKNMQVTQLANSFSPGAPQYPPEVAQNAAIAKGEIAEITGQSDPDMSKAPGQMRSAQALRHWFEEKNRNLSMPARASLKADRDAGRMALRLVRQNYQERRLVSLAGVNGGFDVATFRGEDIWHDIRLLGAPRDSDSQLAFKAEILELIEIGALNPQLPQHFRVIANAFQWNTLDEALSDWTIDQSRQEQEIEEMLADPAKYVESGYPVLEFENHEIHAETLARYMKGETFRSLDEVSKSVLYVHWQMHTQAIQAALQEQLRMQQALQGTPGEKGQASQPARKG